MKMIFAGWEAFPDWLFDKADNFLGTFWGLRTWKDEKVKEHFDKLERAGKMFVLDNGAFSAFTHDTTIDIDELIAFNIKNIKGRKNFYAPCLDVMGDNAITEKNLAYMREKGAEVVPVFQMTTDYDVLERYCKAGDEFVFLGGLRASDDDGKIMHHLTRCFEIGKQYKTKFHGFGVSTVEFCKRHHFFTIDNTSWLFGQKSGMIQLFNEKHCKFELFSYEDKELWKHKDELAEKYSSTYEGMLADYHERNLINIRAWQMLERAISQRHASEYWNGDAPKNGWERNKGNIQKILAANPAAEEKRKENNLRIMKESRYNLKHGKYAKELPLYCNTCYAAKKCPHYQEPGEGEIVVCAMNEAFKEVVPMVKTRNREELIAALDRLRDIQSARAARNLYFESLDGGVIDKALSKLLETLEGNLVASYKIDNAVNLNAQVNIFAGLEQVVAKLDGDTLKAAVEVIEGEVVEIKDEDKK